MRFVDFSPSRSPSFEEQQDALQKGLGRAVQWAKAGGLSDALLLNACLTDLRYDLQVEECRAAWLWQIVQIVDAQGRYRAPLLQALHTLRDERSAYQLCELGYHYAQTGDEAFRTRLYEIVETRPFADCSLLGDLELLRLDGGPSLIFVARVRGKELLNRDWDWHDLSFLDKAIEQLGESEVRNRFQDADDHDIRRFRNRWDNEIRRENNRKFPSHRERMQSRSVSDILSEARDEKPSCGFFRGWGIHATDSDLKIVLARLWEATVPTELACLLRVFSRRALPSFEPRLIALCQHPDSEVRRWAFNALETNSHPAVREFALQQLYAGDYHAIGLLTNNFEQGDEQAIVNHIDLPSDRLEVHSILLDAITMLEDNEDADVSILGVIAYAMTPCESCRFYAARLLHHRQAAPAWLTTECRFDSVEDCRRLSEVGKSTSER